MERVFSFRMNLTDYLTDEDECHEKGKVQVLPEDKINSIINDMDTEFTGNASK